MASLNNLQIIGNLGRDPEMRYTPNGNAVTEFSVACNEQWVDSQGEKQERVEWVNVICWNKLAENVAQYLTKGRQVYVQGRIATRSWEDKESGKKMYRTELIANQVLFLGSRDDAGGGGSREYAGASRYDAPSGDHVDEDDLPF